MKKEITMYHPVLGGISLDEKFQRVLELEPFKNLAFKMQLGLSRFSRTILNGSHTRLTHSVGDLAYKREAIRIFDAKFPWLRITKEEEEVLLLASLGHDIGHLPFSHGLEPISEKSHERRTIELFGKYSKELNEIFGFDITSKTIELFERNIEIKKNGKKLKISEDLDILAIFETILIGTIDCDRMEYLTTDTLLTKGIKRDFRGIFDSLEVVLYNEKQILGYKEKALPLIVELLLTRATMYKEVYFQEETVIREKMMQILVLRQNYAENEKESLTEEGLIQWCRELLKSEFSHKIERRLASIILNPLDKKLLYKSFDNTQDFEFFLQKMKSITKREDYIFPVKKKIVVYNPDKNDIKIICNNGVVKDFVETEYGLVCKPIEINYIIADLDSAYMINEKEAGMIEELFSDNPIEIERKFIINPVQIDNEKLEHFLTSQTGIKVKNNWKEVINDDLYFKPSEDISELITFRLRKKYNGEHSAYYIKIPVNDGTTSSKREEHKFSNCKDMQEFTGLAKELLRNKSYDISEEFYLEEYIKIKTYRNKILLEVQESKVELAIDTSFYEYNGQTAQDYMIECELKEGEQLSLWYLSKVINDLSVEETKQSKLRRAEKDFKLR